MPTNLCECTNHEETPRANMYIHPLLSQLPDAVRKAVSDASSLRDFRKNEAVLRAQEVTDSVYCVAAGLLRVVSTGSGEQDLTTHFLKPDDFYLGPHFADQGYQSEVSLIAALPSSVYVIPRRIVRSLCMAYPSVALGLLDMKVRRLAALGRRMRRVATLSAEQIVGRALYDLTQERPDGRRVIDKRIPQSVIASYAGLSRPVVNKVFKELEARGLIERGGDVYTLSERVGQATNFDALVAPESLEPGAPSTFAAPDFDLDLPLDKDKPRT